MTATTASTKKPFSHAVRLRVLSAAMGATLLFSAAPSHAIFGVGDIVFDPAALARMVWEYAENLGKWYTTVEQYQKEVASFQAQIAQITNIAYSLGIKPGQTLDPVPANHGVAERCGENAIAALGRLITLNPSGDIVAQQKQICANIQMTQNRKYNDTVKFLADNQKEMVKELNQFNQQAATAKNIGDSNKAAQSGVSLTAAQQGRINHYQTQMQAYDAHIATLTSQQQNLARLAMKGKPGVVGTLVKTATLKTALEIGD